MLSEKPCSRFHTVAHHSNAGSLGRESKALPLSHCAPTTINPFYPEYNSSRSYPFYPEYDSSRSLHLARLPRTLTFWNPIGWLTPNDVSISGSLENPYFSTNQCRSLGICRPKSAPPSRSEIKDGVESQRSLNVDVFRRITPLIYFILLMTRRQTRG